MFNRRAKNGELPLFPLVPVSWLAVLLLVTCCTQMTVSVTAHRSMVQEDGSAVAVRHTHDSDRTSRRIDAVQASANNDEDWKPIDYGHPMRDDPTLVYVPPVVDPVHYGIDSAEPLWPIRPQSKLPAFIFPPEVVVALSSSTSSRSRGDVDGNNVERRRQLQQQQQQQQQWSVNSNSAFKLRPIFRPDEREGGGSPLKEVLPRLSVAPLPAGRRQDYHISGVVAQRQQPHLYQRLPIKSAVYERPRDQSIGRPPTIVPAGSGISKLHNVPPPASFTHHQPKLMLNNSINAAAAAAATVVVDTNSGSIIDRANTVKSTGKKTARRRTFSFNPFNFIIQQGHSRVRKYGSSNADDV